MRQPRPGNYIDRNGLERPAPPPLYSYYKLKKRTEDRKRFDDVAVSKSPIMKESAALFGAGEYLVVRVDVYPVGSEVAQGRNGNYEEYIMETVRRADGMIERNQRCVRWDGAYCEKDVVIFNYHPPLQGRQIVDLEMLNMNIVSDMAQTIRENISTVEPTQARIVETDNDEESEEGDD